MTDVGIGSKLLPTIGCCLLLAAPAACTRHAFPLGEAKATTTRAVAMDNINAQVAQAAAKANGWNVEDVVVEAAREGTAGDCRLLNVRSNNVLHSFTQTYAVLRGETVVAPGDADALTRVLDACGDDASAALWAQAVVAFAPDIRPGRVTWSQEHISSVAHKWAMRDGGYSFHPPRFSTAAGNGNKAVEFFMTDLEGSELFQVRATRAASGAVQVDVKPAGDAKP